MKFKVGDIAIARKNLPDVDIEKGDELFVESIKLCEKCGCEMLNLGVITRVTNIQCNCGIIHKTNGIWYLDAALFDLKTAGKYSETITISSKLVLRKLKEEGLFDI